MKKVTGIGGIFFKSDNPKQLRDWYAQHLGIDSNEYGATFDGREMDNPDKTTTTAWNPFAADTTYFQPSKKDFMINYRVERLEELVEELKNNGVIIIDQIQTYSYGKFVHILDLEGNSIELWEPA